MTKPQNVPEISVVIPTLNEAGGIGPLVSKCRAFASEVLVIDGKSTDGTKIAAQNAGARVITEDRRGYGQAYLRGFSEARSEIIATADGDGTYPVELIPTVASFLIQQNLEFVSCCRFPLTQTENMNTINRFGNKLFSLVGSVLWLHHFRDILSGMWVFKKTALAQMTLCSTNWNLSQEIKIEALRRFGPCFAEYHVPYYGRVGEAKLAPLSVGIENLKFFAIQRLGLRKMPPAK